MVSFRTVSKIESVRPFYGNEWVLSCTARLPPRGHQADMQLEWFGPDGVKFTDNSSDIMIGGAHIVEGHMRRD